MRRRPIPPAESSHGEPPQELLHFVPSAPGWWPTEEGAAFLRARAAWRDTHADPLPILPARERIAMLNMELPDALVTAEDTAPKRRPEWALRAEAPPLA